jgi:hypothetical protein
MGRHEKTIRSYQKRQVELRQQVRRPHWPAVRAVAGKSSRSAWLCQLGGIEVGALAAWTAVKRQLTLSSVAYADHQGFAAERYTLYGGKPWRSQFARHGTADDLRRH